MKKFSCSEVSPTPSYGDHNSDTLLIVFYSQNYKNTMPLVFFSTNDGHSLCLHTDNTDTKWSCVFCYDHVIEEGAYAGGAIECAPAHPLEG